MAEYLIYNGRIHYYLYEYLLDFPDGYLQKYPKKRPRSPAAATGLDRGYIATFEIKNNELFLNDIGIRIDITELGDPVLKSVLPEFLAGQPAPKIDWYSGFLIVPENDIRRRLKEDSARCGETAGFENFIIIEIKNGNFVRGMRMNAFECMHFFDRDKNEQHPEHLIYNSKEYILYNEPLHEYFKKYPEKQPKPSAESANLYRGYIATFEIINNGLFLKDIGVSVNKNGNGKPVLKSVLPDLLAGQTALKIDWFTGFLTIPNGDSRKNGNAQCAAFRMSKGGITSYYENYTLIEIKNGDFMGETKMNCLEYRQFRNKLFKESDEYDKWESEFCEKIGGCAYKELK